MTELVRPFRGVSAEDRRAERRRRLIDACLDVVLSEGVAGTTVDRVCAEAGLTKRYLYEGFANLDALLLAAADRMFDEIQERIRTAAEDVPSRKARIRAAVSTLIAALSGDPRFARLYVECPGHPVLMKRREQAITTFTGFVAEVVLPDDTPVDSQRLLGTRVLVAGATDLVTSWLAGSIEADEADIVAALERLGSAL